MGVIEDWQGIRYLARSLLATAAEVAVPAGRSYCAFGFKASSNRIDEGSALE
jgi:hypothetical protein